MRRTFILPLLAACVLAVPAAAQPDLIRPGERVRGELSMADPVLTGGSHFDVWRFPAQANHLYRITLRSTEFDAFLVVGSDIQPGCNECASDDDSGGGTNARVEYAGAEDGTYEIRANSFDEDAMGGYELILEDKGLVAPVPVIESVPIALDQAVEGELVRGDAKDHGMSYSDTYSYQGRAGETLVVTLASEDFDAQLYFGHVSSGACMELDNDDNGGGGTNSRLTVTLAEDGEYHVHVASAAAGRRGRYTLRVERGTPPVEVPAVASPITPGETVESSLTDTDPRRADDGSLYELWSFMGGVGESVTIRMQSSDFDTYLVLGRVRDGAWEELETNDDSADGTNSEITVTLPENGEYHVRANAFASGQTGRYTLRVERN